MTIKQRLDELLIGIVRIILYVIIPGGVAYLVLMFWDPTTFWQRLIGSILAFIVFVVIEVAVILTLIRLSEN